MRRTVGGDLGSIYSGARPTAYLSSYYLLYCGRYGRSQLVKVEPRVDGKAHG